MDNKSITQNSFDWVVSQSLSNESIEKYSKDILSEPTYLLTSSNDDSTKEPLYNIDQMREMFRKGFLMMSHTDVGKDLLEKKAAKPPKAYTRVRSLAVGEKALFPYKQWSVVRTAASQLKRQFGSVFLTRKTTFAGQVGDIEVIRIK